MFFQYTYTESQNVFVDLASGISEHLLIAIANQVHKRNPSPSGWLASTDLGTYSQRMRTEIDDEHFENKLTHMHLQSANSTLGS